MNPEMNQCNILMSEIALQKTIIHLQMKYFLNFWHDYEINAKERYFRCHLKKDKNLYVEFSFDKDHMDLATLKLVFAGRWGKYFERFKILSKDQCITPNADTKTYAISLKNDYTLIYDAFNKLIMTTINIIIDLR